MKLQSNNRNYPKFTNVGDTVEGRFIDFKWDIQGRYGAETVLTLCDEKGETIVVRCPSDLAWILKDNRKLLKRGMRMTITFTRTVPTTKGNDAKLFEVDLDDADIASLPETPEASSGPAAPPPAPPAENFGPSDDEIPF